MKAFLRDCVFRFACLQDAVTGCFQAERLSLRMLEKKGVQQSMSRKGNGLDNAVIGRFFGLLKSELLHLQAFEAMGHFKSGLIDYLDYYNNRRCKAKLKGLKPAIYRLQALQVDWKYLASWGALHP